MGKIVNAHVHFGIPWGPSPHLDVSYTPETLLRDMDRDGVDMSIILPFIFNYDMQWHTASRELKFMRMHTASK